MARSTFNAGANTSTGTNLQTWAAQISAILTAGGFVQTADTGQTDFSTVTATTGNSQSKGYQIWRSNDAAGGLNNWYLKIEVGSGANTPGAASIWITVGWGSDGAGNITGNALARTQLVAQGASGASNASYFWANTEALILGIHASIQITDCVIVSIERVRDITGAKKDEIFIYGVSGSGASGITAVIPRTGAIPANSTTRTNGMRNLPSTMVLYGADSGFSDIAPIKGVAQMPSGNIFGADDTNFSAVGVQNTMTVYNETRTYVTLVSGSWTSGYKMMMRYDT